MHCRARGAVASTLLLSPECCRAQKCESASSRRCLARAVGGCQDAECGHAAARHGAGVKRARDRRGAHVSDARISQLQDCQAAWRRGGGCGDCGGYGCVAGRIRSCCSGRARAQQPWTVQQRGGERRAAGVCDGVGAERETPQDGTLAWLGLGLQGCRAAVLALVAESGVRPRVKVRARLGTEQARRAERAPPNEPPPAVAVSASASAHAAASPSPQSCSSSTSSISSASSADARDAQPASPGTYRVAGCIGSVAASNTIGGRLQHIGLVAGVVRRGCMRADAAEAELQLPAASAEERGGRHRAARQRHVGRVEAHA